MISTRSRLGSSLRRSIRLTSSESERTSSRVKPSLLSVWCIKSVSSKESLVSSDQKRQRRQQSRDPRVWSELWTQMVHQPLTSCACSKSTNNFWKLQRSWRFSIESQRRKLKALTPRLKVFLVTSSSMVKSQLRSKESPLSNAKRESQSNLSYLEAVRDSSMTTWNTQSTYHRRASSYRRKSWPTLPRTIEDHMFDICDISTFWHISAT